MNPTASVEKLRRQVFVRAASLDGATLARVAAFLNSPKSIDVGGHAGGHVDDDPADGPYPDMFAQHWPS
jgi:hypothetical protein